ncbi:N-acetylmuramoyl-L-alanine amidase, partial [Streptomyces scabiei]|nr:N-acetylmuramoyl-L-alanine amidase [Streptomyces scabiei]
MKLVTRAQWGARDYRRPNGATPYGRARRGVKLHYLGTAYTDRAHTQCAGYVRQLQAQHMDGNGWSDIGYSFVVCTHGYVYEGRGLARRNSANGNTALNEQ